MRQTSAAVRLSGASRKAKAPTKEVPTSKAVAKRAVKRAGGKLRATSAETRLADAAVDPEPVIPSVKRKRRPTDAKLIQRVIDAIERELTQIEGIIHGTLAASRSESERRARTLASLARTLTEVRRLRAEDLQKKAGDDDSSVPRDLDELRRTLLQRLARAERTAAARASARNECS